MNNYTDLRGKVAVVTGGATGLGLAITRCLVSAGAKVAVVASRAPELVADTLAEFGGKAVYYQFNITDTDHAQELADKITAEQGPVSILVNNAGNHCKKFIWDMTVDDYKRVLDVHLVGAFALTKAFVPQMKEQGHGRIIFQASMTSYIGQPQVAGYSTAKAGYLGLIHTLTAELAEYGITVHSLMLGNLLKSPMFQSLLPQYATKLGIKAEEVEQYYIDKVPLKRGCDYQDVLNMLLFYASPKASYCTGQSINVTGGQVMF